VGEVGLSGEVRDASDLPRRLEEAARLGFKRAIVPAGRSASNGVCSDRLRVQPVRDLAEALGCIEREPIVLESRSRRLQTL
jgi:DNA repair protein RadA/Sms